jgi:hypothetical protein
MMLALWAAVTFRRPVALRVVERRLDDSLEPNTEIGLIEIPVLADGPGVQRRDELAQLLRAVRVDLELDARVQVLGVLADDHDVDPLEVRPHALIQLDGRMQA